MSRLSLYVFPHFNHRRNSYATPVQSLYLFFYNWYMQFKTLVCSNLIKSSKPQVRCSSTNRAMQLCHYCDVLTEHFWSGYSGNNVLEKLIIFSTILIGLYGRNCFCKIYQANNAGRNYFVQ